MNLKISVEFLIGHHSYYIIRGVIPESALDNCVLLYSDHLKAQLLLNFVNKKGGALQMLPIKAQGLVFETTGAWENQLEGLRKPT